MNKIKIILITLVIAVMVPVELKASGIWTGKDVLHTEWAGETWGFTSDMIAKVENPGEVYSIDDITSYSAHVTDDDSLEGNTVDKTFWWLNNSRLAYVKLINVENVNRISFVFEKELYFYCAQYDGNFRMIDAGDWMTTGDVCNLKSETKWIILTFRKVNGDLSFGSGIGIPISSDEINASKYRYVVFKPFKYQFILNGGVYDGKTGYITKERLGVEKMDLPVPSRNGYSFSGWKSSTGKVYNGTLASEYNAELFKNESFEAVWTEIKPESVKITPEYMILEEKSGERKRATVSIEPADALNKNITWSSSDSSVATVDSNGYITAGKSGTAIITATSSNGLKAQCKVYVMGFRVSIPAGCTLNQPYEIKINVYNNGSAGMSGRKRVIVDADSRSVVSRKGDETTQYNVLAEKSSNYDSGYNAFRDDEYLADTMDSTTVYYRLRPENEITRAGDYSGSVGFSVIVK